MAQQTAERRPQTERERVEAWRLKVFLDAQYPAPLAEKLAANSDVDLHRGVELVLSGCPHKTAYEILH